MSSADPGAPTARSSGGASSASTSPLGAGTPGQLDAAGPSIALDPAAVVRDPVPGIDWRMPAWVRPAANSGFYSEQASDPDRILVRSIDLTWRQLAPREGLLDTTTGTGSAQSMSFDPLDTQLRDGHPFWMRIFASGVDWAPEWVASTCKVRGYGPDDDGMRHLPLWNECVWQKLLATYRALFVDRGLRADPRLRFVYVPGAFTWAEFDFETMNAAQRAGDLDYASYRRWHQHAWRDLVQLFGPYADKLVYTGEDYPFSDFADPGKNLFARDAVAAGMGIRNGIPEEFNFHLSQAPAYGSTVRPDGHLVVDETLPVHNGRYVVGMENECFTDCGFHTGDVPYAVVQTNLKSLQLRANWIYVKPAESYFATLAGHWDWVRLSLGHTAADSADAWADLRDASDEYWRDNDEAPFATRASWPAKPWVRNLERWLVQRDVPGGRAHRATVDVRRGVFVPENGTAYEGLATSAAAGDTALYLDLDDRFTATTRGDVLVQVTFWDAAGPFRVRTGAGESGVVSPGGSKAWRTASVRVPVAALAGGLAGRTDLAVVATSRADVAVRFVRVVRLEAPVAAG